MERFEHQNEPESEAQPIRKFSIPPTVNMAVAFASGALVTFILISYITPTWEMRGKVVGATENGDLLLSMTSVPIDVDNIELYQGWTLELRVKPISVSAMFTKPQWPLIPYTLND